MFIEKDCTEQRMKRIQYPQRSCSQLQKAGKFLRKHEPIKAGVLVLAAYILSCISVYAAKQAILQQNIASEVLRFHVLANSDSEEDQNVKYQVRDAVLAWLEEELESSSEADAQFRTCSAQVQEDSESGKRTAKRETMQGCSTDTSVQKYEMEKMLKNHLREIEKTANKVLEEAGMSYRASAEVVQSFFPDRSYGDCTFAAGWYDALRIKLGEAAGQNWWCVLYPRLCFQDCLHAVVEEDQLQKLEEVLTVEEYESLFEKPQMWKLAFRWLDFSVS